MVHWSSSYLFSAVASQVLFTLTIKGPNTPLDRIITSCLEDAKASIIWIYCGLILFYLIPYASSNRPSLYQKCKTLAKSKVLLGAALLWISVGKSFLLFPDRWIACWEDSGICGAFLRKGITDMTFWLSLEESWWSMTRHAQSSNSTFKSYRLHVIHVSKNTNVSMVSLAWYMSLTCCNYGAYNIRVISWLKALEFKSSIFLWSTFKNIT